MKLLLFVFLILEATPHDIQVAYFKIHEEKDILIVDFTFEKEDITQVYKKDITKVSSKELLSYIENNFSISINNKSQTLKLENVILKDKHVTIRGRIDQTIISNINTLEINNTCLLGIDDHSNIMKIRLHDQERDFLMNSERTTITVNY